MIIDLYNRFIKSNGVSVDSRKINNGQIFFALKGEKFDGDNFAVDAIKKGAICAVVSKPIDLPENMYYVVDNTLASLQKLATYHRLQINPIVIAITGTNGKTTTKELIKDVLQKKYKICYSKGNLNNHIGLPLTILSANHRTEFIIAEMGASHQGDIDFLCSIAKPDYGLITNIGKAHLEGFGSFDTIVKTKLELYNYIKSNGKMLFVNSDDKLLIKESYNFNYISYGTKNKPDVKGELEISFPTLSLSWNYQNKTFFQKTQLFGTYNIYNVLAAINIGLYFKVPTQKIIDAINSYQPNNNRSQIIKTQRGNTIVMDAYNANPTNMKIVIDEFAKMETNSKTLIMGSMLELGDYDNDEHIKILELIKTKNFHKAYFVGESFYKHKNNYPDYIFVTNYKELMEIISKQPVNNSSILIKGSRGIALENVLPVL